MKTYKTKIKQFSLKKNETNIQKCKITDSKTVNEYLRNFYFDDIEIFESFFVLMLNRQNITEGYAKISQGGTAGAVVDIKIIAKYAIDSLANSVILCHNHPAGSLAPSSNDKIITDKIKKTLNLIYIKVLDHIILTKDSYYSFADAGIL